MFVTLAKGFVAHALWQYTKSMFYLACMIAIVAGLPSFTWWLHDLIDGEPPQGLELVALTWWPYVYGGAFIFAILGIEGAGARLYSQRVKNLETTDIDEILQPLVARAGIPMPLIVRMENAPLNAAASRSLLFGGKILVFGELQALLTKSQFKAVLAHEVGHLMNRDLLTRWLIIIMHLVLRAHRYGLLLSVPLLAVAGYRGNDLWFFTWAFFVLWFAETLLGLLAAAHTRAREYLADVAAHALTHEEELRDDLISGMTTLYSRESGWHPLQILARTKISIFQTHPPVGARAKALGVSSRSEMGNMIFTAH